MKNPKRSFKVAKCEDTICPFSHAGIMGQKTCEAENGRDIVHKTDNGWSGPPPSWCPLRTGAIKVTL